MTTTATATAATATDPFIAQLQAKLAQQKLEMEQAKVGIDMDGSVLSGIRKVELDMLQDKHDAEMNHMVAVELAQRIQRSRRGG